MRVLTICDANQTVPPKYYGGTERIADLVCRGLSHRGHTVDLLGAKGSKKYSGFLFHHVSPGKSKVDRIYRKIWFQVLSLRAARRADVILSFGRIDYTYLLQKLKRKIVFRLGNPISQNQIDLIEANGRGKAAIIAVSYDQISGLEINAPLKVIHNCVDLDSAVASNPGRSEVIKDLEGEYFCFLGRLTSNKGVHLAVRAAKETGMNLVIAGNIPNEEKGAHTFFDSEVKPYLGDRIRYIGEVDDKLKFNLLRNAKALLFPIQWREPCANVIPEALACGCPVIAWNCGSVREIVKDREIGLVVNSTDEFLDAINSIGSIDRSSCRQYAELRFNVETMVDKYEDFLQRLISEFKYR